MPSEDEFLEMIKQAEDEAWREWMKDLPQPAWWSEVRDSVIRPALAAADSALKTRNYYEPALSLDICSIQLQVGNPSFNLRFLLTDSGVDVSSSDSAIHGIKLTRDDLMSDQAVREKVRDFIKLAARQKVRQGKR